MTRFMENFDPNKNDIDFCMQRANKAKQQARVDTKNIITSRDDNVLQSLDELEVTNIPDGFKKWQLPVYFEKATSMYISAAGPDVKVPEHSHDEGDGIRVIISGSIKYKGKELTSGDWMFIPAGKKYSFEVGSKGVIMFYCYACCCA